MRTNLNRLPVAKDDKIWTSISIITAVNQNPLKYLNAWIIKILNTNKIQASKNNIVDIWMIERNQVIILSIGKYRKEPGICPPFSIWAMIQGNQIVDKTNLLFIGVFQLIN